MILAGIEPATYGLGNHRSFQLSYRTTLKTHKEIKFPNSVYNRLTLSLPILNYSFFHFRILFFWQRNASVSLNNAQADYQCTYFLGDQNHPPFRGFASRCYSPQGSLHLRTRSYVARPDVTPALASSGDLLLQGDYSHAGGLSHQSAPASSMFTYMLLATVARPLLPATTT